MSTDIPEIIDATGQVRRLGSLMPPKGFVSSFRTFEAEHPVWDDVDIRRAILHPSRVPGRVQFGPSWIQNQRSHGSCNGYAGAGALGKARVRRGLQKLLLSGAWLYSLINRGMDQGSPLEDAMLSIMEAGVCTEVTVPWDQIYPHLQSPAARAEAARIKALKAYPVQTKQGFRTALAAGFPVIVAVMAGGNFQRLNRDGIGGVDNGPGNHAIHCDDICIVNGQEVYDEVNSWGVEFGQQGRRYATWDAYAQTFGHHMFYAIASTEEMA